MGLAVLPSRLKEEMEILSDYIVDGKDIRSNEKIEKHADWVDEFRPKYPVINAENVDAVIKEEIGIVFKKVLEDAGVFKRDAKGQAAFDRFTGTL